MHSVLKPIGLTFVSAILIASCQMSTSKDVADPYADVVPGLPWVHNSGEALATAQKSGQPVLITFYSNSCGWCRQFEKTTLADPKVQLLANKFVLVRLNVDEATDEARRYNVPGVPYTVLLKPNGDMIGRVVGYVDADSFTLKLREAFASGSVVAPSSQAAKS